MCLCMLVCVVYECTCTGAGAGTDTGECGPARVHAHHVHVHVHVPGRVSVCMDTRAQVSALVYGGMMERGCEYPACTVQWIQR